MSTQNTELETTELDYETDPITQTEEDLADLIAADQNIVEQLGDILSGTF